MIQKDLSIILVNTNALDYLKACLPTVYSGNIRCSFEVIIVDNDSTDGSEDYVRQNYPEVKLIQSHMNLGFTRGNNLGYSHSTGRYLLFLNGDTEIYGDAVQKLVDTLEGSEKIGIVGARLLNSDGSLQASCVQAYPTIFNQFVDCDYLQRRFPCSRLWGNKVCHFRDSRPVSVDMVSGACLMIRRDVFEAIGKWDINYFIFSEDLDLCYKTRRAGWKVAYVDHAVILHHGGGSTSKKGQSRFSDVLKRQSLFIFMKKHHGFGLAVAFRASVLLNALLRLGIVRAFMLTGSNIISNAAGSFTRWKWILRWSLGREKWAEELDKPTEMTRERWHYVQRLMNNN